MSVQYYINLNCPHNSTTTRIDAEALELADITDSECMIVHESSTDKALFDECKNCGNKTSRAHVNDNGELKGYAVCYSLRATVGEQVPEHDKVEEESRL